MREADNANEEFYRLRDEESLYEGICESVRSALLDHKRAGNPVAAWRDGRVVIVPPEEIPDFEPLPAEETRAA